MKAGHDAYADCPAGLTPVSAFCRITNPADQPHAPEVVELVTAKDTPCDAADYSSGACTRAHCRSQSAASGQKFSFQVLCVASVGKQAKTPPHRRALPTGAAPRSCRAPIPPHSLATKRPLRPPQSHSQHHP